jgi:flagellar motor component MotA
MTTQIYPNIEDDNNRTLLYKQRSEKIISDIKQLQVKCKHYTKISRKWNRVTKVIEGISYSFFIAGEVAATIIAGLATGGIVLPVFIPLIISGLSFAELSILQITKHTLMHKNKEKYKKKAKLYNDYINRLWLYYEKARQDGIICLEELEGFNKLLAELESKLETEFTNNVANIDIDSLRKQAEIDVKKELNKEYLEKLKQEARQKYSAAL